MIGSQFSTPAWARGGLRGSRAVLLAATWAFACLSAWPAHAQPQPASDNQVIAMERGTHHLLRVGGPVQRVAVGDPSVADVNVINRREVLITSKTLGVTSLLVWRRDVSDPAQYRITVRPVEDPRTQPLPDPALAGANVETGQLAGTVPTLAAHRRALARSQAGNAERAVVDASSVAVGTQVMAQIKIVEVSRSTLQQFGFNFLNNMPNTTIAVSPPGALAGVEQSSGEPFNLVSNSGFRPVQDAFQLVIGDATRSVLGVISLLERRGLARTLAEPSLLASSGQTASFLAGGEFPVPVVQGNSNSVSVEFKEFGVRVNMTPTVLGPDHIALKVAPEVSELDFNAAIQSGGVAVPGLAVRRTETSIEMGDGESFVISGLISNSMVASVDKVPWIGDIPILGAFFRSSRYTRDERELIMVVTPRIVQPIAAGQALPPLPGAALDDYRPKFEEFMFEEDGRYDGTGFSD